MATTVCIIIEQDDGGLVRVRTDAIGSDPVPLRMAMHALSLLNMYEIHNEPGHITVDMPTIQEARH